MTNPTRGKDGTGYKDKCPKIGGMISTFRTEIPSVAVHVLHGKP